MKLKLMLAKAEYDGLPDAIKALYSVAGDGNFHLQVEEDEGAKTKLDEFRTNNIALLKEKEQLEKKLQSMGDPAEIEKMKKKLQEIDDKQMIEAGKLDELLAQRTDRMRTDYENQINQLKGALDERDKKLGATNQRLSEVLIDGEITRAVNDVGVVRKDAIIDVIARGRRTWTLDESGNPVPQENGKLLYGTDGKGPLTFKEWAQALVTQAPFLFEASGGGGAAGGADRTKIGGGFNTKPSAEQMSKMPASERLKWAHENPAK